MLPKRKRDRRHGFTLLEMLLTMAILVVIATVVWPVLFGLQSADALDRSADDIRALMAGMRLRAIQESTLYTMTMQPETGIYRIEAAGQAPNFLAEPGRRAEFDSASFIGEHQLEEGVRFSPVQQSADSQDGDDNQNQAGELAVKFYPDGTANDLEFMLVDSQEISRLVRVRGLTGLVSIGEPTSLTSPGQGTVAGQTGGRR